MHHRSGAFCWITRERSEIALLSTLRYCSSSASLFCSNFLVWTIAARNRHYVVTLASLMVIVTLCISPLSGALFSVRDTYLAQPDQNATSTRAISLNLGDSYQDLTGIPFFSPPEKNAPLTTRILAAFVTAAGYASASILYSLGDPSFVHDGYTVAPFEVCYSSYRLRQPADCLLSCLRTSSRMGLSSPTQPQSSRSPAASLPTSRYETVFLVFIPVSNMVSMISLK